MPDRNHSIVGVVADGAAWAVFLIPLAIAALIFGLPYVLQILGGIFDLMRDGAAMVKA